ncbi:alpha- -mannosyltransferase [Ophiostoma piceae UAMH 11346]|uniref:Alpha--mannosyltransferase n=1 Tax=Ophiostoma piceae (strain UAMH 11346) TaxID=1262450 RepID=S3BWZ6_OPHP1|nr:alpha- -mannosyltransferase [Ophiostoma piceae UAMH 11346]
MTAKFTMLRALVPVSRRKTAAIRCTLAAVLFVAFFLFHTTSVSSDAARIIGWTPQTTNIPGTVPATETKPTTDSEPPSSDADENTANAENTGGEKTASEDAKEESIEEGKARPSKLGDAVMELLERHLPSQTVPDWTERFEGQLWHWGNPDPVNVTDKLTLNKTELATIKKAHQGFIDAVNTRLPEYVPHRYGNSSTWTADRAGGNQEPPKTPTRGIVIVGGGKFNVILSVSLRFLRRAGTTLPVEVFLTEGEYEKDVCENLFPSLNATCRVYPKMHKPVNNGFQLKSFALLFSSFDEILFLDADNTAMRDVAPLFESPPFKETGLVTWPDFWEPTVSPLYHDIAGTKPVAVSERPSSETGQLLIDKVRHWKTLLLITYYNFYGADFYYRLLNQGFTGMGDKETVLPAAAVFGLPSYQVHMPIEKIGHRFEDNSVGGRVMVQYDPGEDWILTKALASGEDITDNKGKAVAKPTTEQEWKHIYHQRVKPVFLHTNWPKWDPTDMLGHISKWSDMTTGVTGKPEPAFSYPQDLASEIYGTERVLWEEALWLACNMRTRFRHWRNNGKAVHTCDNMKRHFQRVFDTDVGRAIGLGPEDALFPKLPDEMDSTVKNGEKDEEKNS